MKRKAYVLWALLPLIGVWCEPLSASDPTAVTVKYRAGRRGYDGIRGIWLAKHAADESIHRRDNDLLVGRFRDVKTYEFRGLLNFTGRDLPKGSRIVRATIRLDCTHVSGKPRIAIYGLLKEFTAPAKVWDAGQVAQIGETTWNHQRHGKQAWGRPGAGKAGKVFEYDKDCDHYADPDAVQTLEMDSAGLLVFDVTRSFANQFHAGKEYGWLLVETSGKAYTFIGPVLDGAELEVTYEPPAGAAVSPSHPIAPVLICRGLVEPHELRGNLDRIEQLPFEGTIFWGMDNQRTSDRGWICNSVFGPDQLDAANYSNFIEDARFIQRSGCRLKHNFLLVNLTVPGTLEKRDQPYTWETRPREADKVSMWWAEGFDTVVSNLRVAATVARDAGLEGLVLVNEEFGGNIWRFELQKDAQTLGKSLAATKVQVRKRAERLIRAVNEVYPRMTLIMIFWIYRDNPDSLWNSFADGIVAGSDPRMRLVDGNERGYKRLARAEFRELYDWDYRVAPTFSTVPKKYLRQLEVGFGVWLNPYGWGKDPEVNFSSAMWQATLENALAEADSYVWVFTLGEAGGPNWWTGENLPKAYLDATRRAVELTGRRRIKP